MYSAHEKEFEKMIEDGLGKIPADLRAKMNNVFLAIEDEPTDAQLARQGCGEEYDLFGLYEGIPLAERGAGYGNAVPDRITIFKGPIQREALDKEDCARIVAETVWHEVAHHFGLDEERVLEAEKKRRSGAKGA